MQTFRDVEWFPLLPDEEAEGSLELDSDDEDDDGATESEPEIITRTRYQRKLAATTPPESPATKEVATGKAPVDSPKRRRSPSQVAVEKESKRLKQTSILDTTISLTRPMGPVLAAAEAAGKDVKQFKAAK